MEKHFVYIMAMLLLSAAALNGCKKMTDTNPPASTTRISGTVSPAKAIASITATNLLSNKVYQAAADTVTGNFKIDNMDTGSYRVSFTSASTYLAPAPVSTTVIDKQNTNIGNVVFTAGAGISGIVGQVGAVIYVNVFSKQTSQSYIVTPDAVTGAFKASLPAGNYIVTFIAAAGYRSPYQPTGIDVTLTLGQSTDIGTFLMLRYFLSGIPSGLNSYSLNYAAPNLNITSGGGNIDNGSSKQFKITMDSIPAPGTYVCKNTATSNITYTAKNSSFSPTITWNTINTGGSGTVVVTSIDTVKKEIMGTFTAILTNPSNANVVINNGSFDFVYQ